MPCLLGECGSFQSIINMGAISPIQAVSHPSHTLFPPRVAKFDPSTMSLPIFLTIIFACWASGLRTPPFTTPSNNQFFIKIVNTLEKSHKIAIIKLTRNFISVHRSSNLCIETQIHTQDSDPQWPTVMIVAHKSHRPTVMTMGHKTCRSKVVGCWS